MIQSRTHNCGELRSSDEGKEVTLCGWVENVREVGGNLSFISKSCRVEDSYVGKAKELADQGKTPLFFEKDGNKERNFWLNP